MAMAMPMTPGMVITVLALGCYAALRRAAM